MIKVASRRTTQGFIRPRGPTRFIKDGPHHRVRLSKQFTNKTSSFLVFSNLFAIQTQLERFGM